MIKVWKSGYILRERKPPPEERGEDYAELERLRRLYTKSGTSEPPRIGTPELPKITDGEELLRAIQAVNDAFIAHYTSNPEIPPDMKKRFENELQRVAGGATDKFSEQYIRDLQAGTEIEAALEAIIPDLQKGAERMQALATEFERELLTYLLMKRNEEFGYSWYLFICENGDDTCDECSSRDRRLYSLADFEADRVIRGLHPNCRCRIIQMNRETADGFLKSDKYMDELEAFLDKELGTRGGVYLLTYVDFYYISTSSTIMEISPEYVPSKFGQFFIDAKAAWDAFVENHHSYGYKGGVEGLSNGEFALWLIKDSINFLLLGIPGAIYDSTRARLEEMFEDPSFYTIANNFSYGILETVLGAINPDEPFSFQHIMDVMLTLLIGYGAYKGTQHAIARSQPPRLPSTGPAYVPPGADAGDDAYRVGSGRAGSNSWYKSDGSINYPTNDGAVIGTEANVTLQPGQVLGRYGGIGAKSDFITASGASPNSLSLPPNTNPSLYTEIRILKPIPGVIQSTIAEWPIGSGTGGGIQYKLPMPLQILKREGYITY